MKKITIVFVIMLMISVNLEAQESLIIGNWLLTNVEVEGKVEEVFSEVIFKNDGYVEMGGRVFGKWNYNKKAKTVIIESEMIKEFAGERKVSKLNGDEMVLSGSEMNLFFEKTDPETIEKENKNSKLEGIWKVSNDEVDKTLLFKLPDSFVSVDKSDGAKSTSRGTWMYNSKKKSLVIMTSDRELRGKNIVIKITDNELELENKGNVTKASKEEQKNIKIERLTFSEDDFFDNNGDFKYYDDEEKLPWKDEYVLLGNLEKINELVYNFSTLIEETESFDTQKLIANVTGSRDEGIVTDNIFDGYDRVNLPEDTEMPVVSYDPYDKLYPFDYTTYRVAGEENITTPAGTFNCTVIEATGSFDEKIKLWLVNENPGIFAKVIKDQAGDFGYYKIFELVEIK